MKLFKLAVILAGLTGVVLWSNTKAEAPAGEAEAWLSECLDACDAHGTADPSYCPVIFNCRDL
jgi:hypothetical protein